VAVVGVKREEILRNVGFFLPFLARRRSLIGCYCHTSTTFFNSAESDDQREKTKGGTITLDVDISITLYSIGVSCLWSMYTIQLHSPEPAIFPNILSKPSSETRLSFICPNPLHNPIGSRCSPGYTCTQCGNGTDPGHSIKSICKGNEDAILERCSGKLLSRNTESRTGFNTLSASVV